jgi:diguanylate cyclase (GGDEF)-like protein
MLHVLILERSLEETRRLRDLFVTVPAFKPHTAKNVNEAIAALQEHNIDVAIIESSVWLKRNGDLARQLRAASPETGFLIICEGAGEGRTALKRGAHDEVVRANLEIAPLSDRIANVEAVARQNRRRDTMRLWMERVSRIDDLTGLQNRKTFLEHLRAASEAAVETGEPLTVLVIDIAGTSAVNQAYGFEAGDDLIRRAALGLTRCLRSTDLAGRVGGDEFAVILPGAPLEVARRIARRVAVEIGSINERQWAGLPPILLNFAVLDAAGRDPGEVLASVKLETRAGLARTLTLLAPAEEERDGPSVA